MDKKNMDMKFVKRFSLADRRLHWWYSAGLVILLISGIVMYFIGAPSGSIQKVSHLTGALLFFFAPVIYLYKAKGKRKDWLFIFKWDSKDFEWFKGLFSGKKPAQGRYTTGQKLFFLIVVLASVVSAISGFILMFKLFSNSKETTLLFHNISTWVLGILFVLHASYYLYKPKRRALRSMIKGIMDVKYAEEHHQLWFEQVKGTAFSPNDGMKPSKKLQSANK